MKSLLLTRIFFVFSFLIMTSLAMADSSPEDTSDFNKTAENHDCESPDSKCSFIKANSGLQPIFVATASVAPALGQYSYLRRFTFESKSYDLAHIKGRANFISGDISLGWTFIDPRTEHFSHTVLLRSNLQSTLIPAKLGDRSDLPSGDGNLYEDRSLTRTDQSLELFYKLGIKKHNFNFSLGEKQSKTVFSSNDSAWSNSEVLSNNAVKNSDGSITLPPSSNNKVDIKEGGTASFTTNSSYKTYKERLTTKGEFVGFGYDYLINEAQNIRLGANASYMKLKAEHWASDSGALPSGKGSSLKWGLYLQGEMFKLDRSGKLTYTLSYDNAKYDIQFPKASVFDEKVQEKLQTLSFAINYIFF